MIQTRFMKQEDLHHYSKIYSLANSFRLDFHKLALLSPTLRQHILILDGRSVINFKNQQSLIELTSCIMRHIFQYQWSCPEDNLCPRIPSRLNYLLWIHHFRGCSNIKKLIDIGTGAGVIYPLLGWRVFGSKFIATEIDAASYKKSTEIIKVNNL